MRKHVGCLWSAFVRVVAYDEMKGVMAMNMKKLRVLSLMCCVVSMLALTPVVQGAPEAICVPWQPSNLTKPHFTYSGAQITLKGIARGDATEYRWDFGDGGSTSWAPVTDPYNLGVTHTYTGIVTQPFSATLYVKDGLGEEDQCTYKTRIHLSSDLSDPAQMDVRINMAIDEGLWWLHRTMIRGTYGAGSPGYDQPYGWWDVSGGANYDMPAVGTAVDAFQLHGSKVIGDYDGNPYVETVQRGMNYILCHTYDHGIGGQTAGDPDTNGNGIGLFINYYDSWSNDNQTYIGGICAITVASSGAPNRIASVGGANVYGRYHHEIVQDLVDYFAWGQVDAAYGQYRGGWRYRANYTSSDMSTTQWPVLAMLAAEENMGVEKLGPEDGVTVPPFVRTELPYFLNYTRHDYCDTYYGGYGYSTDSDHINCLKAAVGIICREWLDTPLTDPNITGALGYLYRHWNDNGYPPGTNSWQSQPIHGNSYGMYAAMKAMRVPEPDMEVIVDYNNPPSACDDQPTGNTLDWYYATGSGSPQGAAGAYYQEGLAHYAVRKQHGDGSWDDTTGPNPVYDAFSTGWQILTLLKGVTILPPVAVICDCDEQEYDWNQDINLNASCSHHPDDNRTIVSYEWDLDNDGEFDDAVGINATIVGGFPATDIYPVALRVTDDTPGNPQTDIYECDIDVHPPPHCPHAFAHPVPEGEYIGWVNVPVQLDGSASLDPNDNIESYDWDLDNDGLYGAEDDDCFGQPSDAVGVNPVWTWDEPYEGEVGLRVTDSETDVPPCSDFDWAPVVIGNHRPVADPKGPYTACASCTITLNGCDSYDPDPGDEITYAWDLDNDGYFDDSTECDPEFSVGPDVGTVYDVCLKVTDSFDEYDVECTTVGVVEDRPPVCDANGPYAAECEGSTTSVMLDGTASEDPDPGDTITFEWSNIDCPGANFDDPTSAEPLLTVDSTAPCSVVCHVRLVVTDNWGEPSAPCDVAVMITDTTAPVITSLNADDLVQAINVPVNCSVEFSDDCGAPHVATWDFGDGTLPLVTDPAASPTSASHAYAAQGIYSATVTVEDSCRNAASDSIVVVVYDPNDGFVTGGGWIDSPEGAYMPDTSLTGKANFGFVAKYKKRSTEPDGQTEFQFHVADLNFHSSGYEWLVVTGSDYAMFKGSGTINGEGDYRFRIWAGDRDPDTFRIKIWVEDEDTGEETVIYDNGFDQEIAGGSVQIHKK